MRAFSAARADAAAGLPGATTDAFDARLDYRQVLHTGTSTA
jgi:hypothetical protein